MLYIDYKRSSLKYMFNYYENQRNVTLKILKVYLLLFYNQIKSVHVYHDNVSRKCPIVAFIYQIKAFISGVLNPICIITESLM